MFFCAWPAFWVYHRVVPGRTRVVVVYRGKVLVRRQWIGDGRWGLPGGGLHKGEDAAKGAARELREETGVVVVPEKLKLVGEGRYERGVHRFNYVIFAVAVASPKTRAQWYEVSDLAWVDPDELDNSNTTGDALHAVRAVRKKTTLL